MANVDKTKNVVVGNASVCHHSSRTIETEIDVEVHVTNSDAASTLNVLPLIPHNVYVRLVIPAIH